MKSLAIIPARAGSKRLPGKNRELVGGIPLWRRALDCAHAAHCNEIVLVTDDAVIIGEARAVAESIPFRVLTEPEDVASDETPMIRVVQLALQNAQPCDAVVLLQPTSPLRTADDVAACLSIYQRSGCDAVVSVTARHRMVAPQLVGIEGHGWLPVSASPAELRTYERNGAVYVSNPALVRRGEFIGGWTQFYVMPPERSVDVDTAGDLEWARRMEGS